MKKILLIITTFFFGFSMFSQQYIVKFKVKNKKEAYYLPEYISVDEYKDNTVKAYLYGKNFEKFKQLGYDFTIEDHPSKGKSLTMATTVAQMANWDRYPTFDVLNQMIDQFATDYPDICRVETIGISEQGRDVKVIKITDNPDIDEEEPEFYYTGQMHGDEIVAYIMFLRLADYLLSNYGTDTRVTNLINNVEIWINPLSNPDGTYAGGNNTVSSATRANSNSVDLNRNFPSPNLPNPSGQNEAEVQMQITFAQAHNFVMSANSHSGIELVNYPWDTWKSSHPHADNDWWEHVSYNYADTVHANAPSNYFTGQGDGVTHGGDWYVVDGSRQDNMGYFQYCREVTLELSDIKMLDCEVLPAHWNYNRSAMLGYIEECLYGFNGTVKNTNGDPLNAKIEITSHDIDNSEVYTDPAKGDYYRPIAPGTYNVTYSSFGYTSQTNTITVTDWETTTIKDVILDVPSSSHTLTGTVVEDGTGTPIENVMIEIIDIPTNPVYTIADGTYEMIAIEDGTYQIKASKDGYLSEILNVTFSGNDVILNFTLKPNITVSGTVTEEGTGMPLENVKIEIIDSGLAPVFTNSSGSYSISDVPQTTQNIKAYLAGYTSVIQNVDISTTTVVDFTLSISNAISFESEVPSIFTFAGNLPWTRVTPEAYDGDYSMKSGNISDNQTSVMQTELNITAAGDISFYKKVSSESGYDKLNFYIDGTLKDTWSGTIDWSQESYPVTTTGLHTFKWVYSKDGSVSNGSDCAWVDYIEFPQYEEPATYTVTFNVSDGTNPIQNAAVTFNSQNKNTDASGIAVFTEVDPGNNLPWSVSKTGYNSENGTLNIVNTDVDKNVTLTEIVTYTVTFNVIDASSNPIENANVNFNSQNISTDASGQSIFNSVLAGNNLPYTISKTGFFDYNGTLDVVDTDVTEDITMNIAEYTVTFVINDGINPIENANVNFNSEDVLTDINGHAVFNNVSPENNIPYIITKTGYNTYNGTLNVNSNVQETISLSSNVNVNVLLKHSGIKVSPNPFKDFVTIQFYIENNANTIINIYSCQGKLIKSVQAGELSQGNHQITWNASDSSGQKVSNGIYFIKVISENTIRSKKIFLIN